MKTKPKPLNVFLVLDSTKGMYQIPAVRFAPKVDKAKPRRYLLP